MDPPLDLLSGIREVCNTSCFTDLEDPGTVPLALSFMQLVELGYRKSSNAFKAPGKPIALFGALRAGSQS